MKISRRRLCNLALAALPAFKLSGKPNSKFGGIQIGAIISPTNFSDIPLEADQLLPDLVQLGISGIEMQDVRIESYAGAPQIPGASFRSMPLRNTPSGQTPSAPTPSVTAGRRTPLTAEQMETRRKAAKQLSQWRLSAPLEKYKTISQMYREAGVDIYAFRLSALSNEMSQRELVYFFDTAETLGARQITVELPTDPALSQRLGECAAQRKMMVGFHNHTHVDFHSWDVALSQSAYNGINFDVGHFTAAVSQSPIPFIRDHHDRIASLHLKDRKLGTDGGQNMPWGQGDTPIKEILLLMKEQKYTFPAAIELEYPIPEGSSTVAELSKCLHFCKDVLT